MHRGLATLFLFTVLISGCSPSFEPKRPTRDAPPEPDASASATLPPPRPTLEPTTVPTQQRLPTSAEPPAGWATYENTALGYRVRYPEGWVLDTYGLSQATKEVLINPPQPEPFVAYLSIGISSLTLAEIRAAYSANTPEAQLSEIVFAGVNAIQVTYLHPRVEVYLEHDGRTYWIATDRWSLLEVHEIFSSFELLTA